MIEENKKVVLRFNREVLEQGNKRVFDELMHPQFINHTSMIETKGPESMWTVFQNMLRPAFPDLKVEIYEQIGEGDLVTTRKALKGTHLGTFAGIEPTQRSITIDVIDIVRVRDGKYFEHWGMNSMQKVIAELKQESKQ